MMPTKAKRAEYKAQGMCGQCGARPPAAGRAQCSTCSGHTTTLQRSPEGWANHKLRGNSACGRTRAARGGFETFVTPAELLTKAIATFGYCDLTNRKSGLPWEHVGDKNMGLETDHIFTQAECKTTGREWNHIDNIQFLSKRCHALKTASEVRVQARKWLAEGLTA